GAMAQRHGIGCIRGCYDPEAAMWREWRRGWRRYQRELLATRRTVPLRIGKLRNLDRRLGRDTSTTATIVAGQHDRPAITAARRDVDRQLVHCQLIGGGAVVRIDAAQRWPDHRDIMPRLVGQRPGIRQVVVQ